MEETYTKLLLYKKLPDHICRNILQIIYCRKTKELNFSLNPLPLCVRQLSGEVSLHLDLNCTNFLKYCFRAGYIYIAVATLQKEIGNFCFNLIRVTLACLIHLAFPR